MSTKKSKDRENAGRRSSGMRGNSVGIEMSPIGIKLGQGDVRVDRQPRIHANKQPQRLILISQSGEHSTRKQSEKESRKSSRTLK